MQKGKEERFERSIEQQQNLHRSLRFVEQICSLLKLSRPCTKTSMDYFYNLSNSRTHQFQLEIIIGAAIFLAAKIFETERKIRDILNMIFAVTSLHRFIQNQQSKAEENGVPSPSIKQIMKHREINEAVQPTYSLNNYNQFKPKILEAEQHLLRILGFDFSQAQKNLTQMKSILKLIHQLRFSQEAAQAAINTYNDLPFTGAEKWIAGIMFFGYQVGTIAIKRKGHNEQNIIKEQQWQTIFCTKIEKLINYATKIANYYEAKLNEKQLQDHKIKKLEIND